MTGDQALQQLLDVSEDVVAAVVFELNGEPIGATVNDEEARSVAETAAAMLAYADALRAKPSTERLQAVTAEGSIFVVRKGSRAVVAATGRDPVAGLVLHDLRAALKNVKRRTREQADAAS
jgi:predicted regulator of Ras-like GTPase activity (Roadblock/LC7/MglB family)